MCPTGVDALVKQNITWQLWRPGQTVWTARKHRTTCTNSIPQIFITWLAMFYCTLVRLNDSCLITSRYKSRWSESFTQVHFEVLSTLYFHFRRLQSLMYFILYYIYLTVTAYSADSWNQFMKLLINHSELRQQKDASSVRLRRGCSMHLILSFLSSHDHKLSHTDPLINRWANITAAGVTCSHCVPLI